jgi:DNA-binding response OmpR family regulator
MHGITFLDELKANDAFKAIPVVIISNLGQQEEVSRGLKSGAVDYIVKANSTPGEILEKVESILNK